MTLPGVTLPTSRRRIAAGAALFVVACAWGATFPLAKEILRHLGPFQYLALRFGAAALVLVPAALVVAARSRRRDRARAAATASRSGARAEATDLPQHAARAAAGRARRWALATGLALAAGYAFQTLGLETAAATTSAFITGLSVVLVPVLGVFWKRAAAPAEWLGVATAAAGLAMLTLQGTARPGAGELLVLACAACFAAHIVVLDRAAPLSSPLALGAWQMACTAIVCAALAPLEPAPARVPATILAAVVAMGLVASAAAFTIQAWAQRFTSPTHVGLIFASEPVAAALFARLWLGERLAGRQWIGAALILAGIVLAELRPAARRAPKPFSRSRTP